MIFIFIKTESFEKASSKCFVRVDLFNTHLIAEYIHPNMFVIRTPLILFTVVSCPIHQKSNELRLRTHQ